MHAVRPHLAAMGITRIARLTGLDTIGIPVSACIRPAARSLSVSQGKGLTEDLADVSAVMESIECFHAENLVPTAIVGTAQDAQRTSSAVMEPSIWTGPFVQGRRQDAVIDWTSATDLLTGTELLVPRAVVGLDLARLDAASAQVRVTSNGLASGNTLEEATCHALFELIERDSVQRWTEAGAEGEASEIDLATVSGPALDLLASFERAGVIVRVWDATGDLGVATFVCHVRDRVNVRGLATFVGMGAHFSRDIAMCRALTEAAQSRLTMIAGSRDDLSPAAYRHQAAPLKGADAKNGQQGPPHVDYSTCGSEVFATTMSEMLDALCRRLVAGGHAQLLRVDLTSEQFGVPVVRMIVPGMKLGLH